MMAAMTGPTASMDARGPHLPDRLTALPAAIWPFVLVAALAVAAWLAGRGPLDDPASTFWSIVGLVGPVATALTGAALFLRHPGAWTTDRRLAIGVALLAVGELLTVVASPIGSTLDGLVPASGGAVFSGPIAGAFDLLRIAIEPLALIVIALGLGHARRTTDDPAQRRRIRLAIVAGAAVVFTVEVIFSLGSILPGELAPSDRILILGGVATAAFWLAGWAYLAIVALAGWRSGEEPATAWLAAAAGPLLSIGLGVLGVLISIIVLVVGVVDLPIGLASVLGALPAVLLFVAFAAGLPRPAAASPVARPTSEAAPA